MHTVRSSPLRPISPMNAMPLGIGNSKKLKKTKFVHWFIQQRKVVNSSLEGIKEGRDERKEKQGRGILLHPHVIFIELQNCRREKTLRTNITLAYI